MKISTQLALYISESFAVLQKVLLQRGLVLKSDFILG